mgnify:CR=1 FL=1
MPKKLFQYKQIGSDIWYTDSLKGWFIVKDKNQYIIKKGSIINEKVIEFGVKNFKTYQRLGDAKVGIENMLKKRVKAIKQQEELFNELQKLNKKDNETKELDYEFLNKEAESLKKKWGLC